MLGGHPPFRDPKRQNLFRKIRKGQYDFLDTDWNGVSDSARDMINHLLTVDPSKRVTAQEALQHPWVTGERDTVKVETIKGPVKRVGSAASLNNSSSMLSSQPLSIHEAQPVEHPHPSESSIHDIDVDEWEASKKEGANKETENGISF
jgi:serine/threonine protein kinase